MRLFPNEFAATVAKVAKINDRARKRGFTGRLEVHGARKVVKNAGRPPAFPNLPVNAEVVVYETTIDGEAPCYEGWEFLAALDSLTTSDGGTEWVVRCAPGVTDESVDRAKLRPGSCDHCNTDRANRRKLYLVRSTETGVVRQVGATCIKDFLGWHAMPVFIGTDDVIDSDHSAGGGGQPAFTPRFVVVVALAAVAAFGWVPRSRAQYDPRATSTANTMMPYLIGPASGEAGKADREVIAAIEPHIAAAEAQADEVIDTVLAQFADATYGYEANLRSALRAEHIEFGQLGITASVVPAYERIIGKRAEQQAKPKETEPEYLGEVGEKVEFTGIVTTAMTVDGYAYNSTQNLIVITTDTALVKFYSAAAWTYKVKLGDTVTVAATIKKLDIWNEKKQTVIVRPKLVPAQDDADDSKA